MSEMETPAEYSIPENWFGENKSSSNRDIKYACSDCGREVGKRNLVAKRAVFKEIGIKGRTVKTRTIKWLCIIPNGEEPSCRDKDPDWRTPARVTSPGMADTNFAKVYKRVVNDATQ